MEYSGKHYDGKKNHEKICLQRILYLPSNRRGNHLLISQSEILSCLKRNKILVMFTCKYKGHCRLVSKHLSSNFLRTKKKKKKKIQTRANSIANISLLCYFSIIDTFDNCRQKMSESETSTSE